MWSFLPHALQPPLKQQYTASRCSVGDDRRERSRERRRKSEEGDTRHSQIRGNAGRSAREPASEHFRSEPSVSESEGETSESSGSESESPTPSENVSTTQEDQVSNIAEILSSMKIACIISFGGLNNSVRVGGNGFQWLGGVPRHCYNFRHHISWIVS